MNSQQNNSQEPATQLALGGCSQHSEQPDQTGQRHYSLSIRVRVRELDRAKPETSQAMLETEFYTLTGDSIDQICQQFSDALHAGWNQYQNINPQHEQDKE